MNIASFADILRNLDFAELASALGKVRDEDVRAALARESLRDEDAVALFSPAATGNLETMARKSAAVTERRFGRVIQLYAPLYLSNECSNTCLYCGFSANVDIKRTSLTIGEAVEEAEHLHKIGFRHILLVTGDSRGQYNVDAIAEVAQRLRGRFASIAIEVFPMTTEEYTRLERAGVDALTLYQETYLPDVYASMHLKGPKKSYERRLVGIENGGEAGFRSLGVGALLGLADWRIEAVLLAWHARYLTKRFWKSRVAVSFPRVNPAEAGFSPPHPVTDAELLQMIIGMRLLLPDAELVLSTRERAAFRDGLVGLGITRMSAGSRTSPGGYSKKDAAGRQFEVSDDRPAAEVAAMIESRGFEPVWKDFDAVIVDNSKLPDGHP